MGNIASFGCLSTFDEQPGLIHFLFLDDANDDTIRAERHENIKMHKNIICPYFVCVTLLFANSVLFSQNLKQTLANDRGK